MLRMWNTRKWKALCMWWANELLGCLKERAPLQLATIMSISKVDGKKSTINSSNTYILYILLLAQKISTEGKAKVQLQVVLHDDTSSTFHFVSPGGPQQQIKDRDQVKDLLAALLPKFKQKISKELEEKKRYRSLKVLV